jgi:hypothetical protein
MLDDQRPTNDRPTTDQRPTTNKKKKNIRTKELKDNKENKFDPASICPSFISIKTWDDLIQHRRTKKAAQTERAYTAIIVEIVKAREMGFSADDCVDKICQRNWTGFDASWMAEKTNGNGKIFKKQISFKEQCALELLGMDK